MIRRTLYASLFALAAALPAQAEQYAVQLDAAYDGASAKLMAALKISELEHFSEADRHYLVVEAPNEAYVEAFILAIGREATALNVLEADWSNPVMGDLTMAQRLGFLRVLACGFCTS